VGRASRPLNAEQNRQAGRPSHSLNLVAPALPPASAPRGSRGPIGPCSGQKPNIALSDLVRDIKAGSSGFINDRRWVAGRFSWQEGFGAFSYSHSQLGAVIRYIQNQQEHHRDKTFREEYEALLKRFNVQHEQRYIFLPVEAD
jgi:transposase IS200 family protein